MQDDSAGPVIPAQQDIVLGSGTPSIAIRGPPDLPGLQLVDPDPANLAGQIIYLDFDGEQNVTYNGPVTVGPFDVPAFHAPSDLAGQERTVITDILARLGETFAGSGVLFTISRPQEPGTCSTIYIGGDDSAFAAYGSFLGLAEQVDVGNVDGRDNGIVFTDQIAPAGRGTDPYCSAMARLIAHEAGHLLGFRHIESCAGAAGLLHEVALPVNLPLGTDLSGTLDGSGDSDSYSVNVPAGEHLVVQLDADNTSDDNELYIRYGSPPTLTEYDVAGKEADRADQYAEIPGTQAGTYYVLVSCTSDALYSSDGYVIRADTDATLPTLTLGSASSGTLVNTYDFDLYRVEVAAGQKLFVQLDADNASDNNELYIRYGALPTLTEYDVAATGAGRSDRFVQISDTQAGTYYVLVRCISDSLYSSDGYVIRADTDATLPTLTLGAASSGTLVNTQDFDLYRVEVGAGQRLVVQLDADNVSDDNELYIRSGASPTPVVYDAAGKEADRSDQYAEIAGTQAGTYYVLVSCTSDALYSSDGYVIRADTDATLPTLTLGAASSGTLVNTYDFDLYRVEVGAGQKLFVQLDADNASDNNELYIRYGASPTLTEYDLAATGAGRSDRGVVIGTQAGTYYILARCVSDSLYSSDGYVIRADTDATLPTLTLGEDRSGTLVNTQDFDLYRVEVEAGQHLMVQLNGDNASDDNELYIRYEWPPTLTEYDAAGKEADRSDQYLEIPSTQAGTYYVLVECTADALYSSDGYTLRAYTPGSLPLLAVPGQVTGSLANPGDTEFYRMWLDGSQDVILTLRAGSAYPQNEVYVRLEGLPTETTYDFAAVAPGANQLLYLQSPAAGTYYIMVRGAHTWPQDDFTLTADTELTWHVLDLGQAEAITLLPNEIQLYYVDVPPDGIPGELFLTLQKDSSWYGTLGAGAMGGQMETRSGSGDLVVDIPLDAAGRYVIQVAAGPSGGTGHLTAGLSLPELTLGQWTVGTIYRTYGSAWYQLDVPAGQATLSFDVETLGLWSQLQVFHATLDTTPDWGASGCKMHLNIPNPPAGRYYVHLTDSAWISGPQSRDHMIFADTTGQAGPVGEHAPVITGLSTYTGGTSASVTVVISGAWLNEDATVILRRPGDADVMPGWVEGVAEQNRLGATFDLADVALGDWTVIVRNPDGQEATSSQPFTVVAGGQPELWVEIIARETIRVSRSSTVIVRYGNSGTVDAPYPVLVIGGPAELSCQVDVPDAIPQNPLGPPPAADALGVTLIDLPSLAAHSSGELSVDITAGEVGQYNFYARITGDPSPYFESALALPDQVWPMLGIDVSSALDAEQTADLSLYPQQWLGRDPPAGYIGLWKYGDGSFHIAKSIGDRDGNGRSEIIEMWNFDLEDTGDIRIHEWAGATQDTQGFVGFWRPSDNYDPSTHGSRVQAFADELMYHFGDPESNEWTGAICDSKLVDDGHYLKLRTNCLGFFHLLNPEFRSRGLYLPEQIYDAIAAPRKWSDGWDPLGKLTGWLWMHSGCRKAFDDFAKSVSKQIHGVDSVSPEDKYGPAGYGAEHWIAADGQIHYRTDFWNKEDAPANTQEVIIKDQLDSDLDWSTFSFTRTGFLRWDRPLDGGQYFNVDIDMRPDMNLVVNVEGTFNSQTGEIQWVFRSLDPDTGTWPEDPTAGFLPPITNSGYEIGWVEYTVEQKPDLPSGTQVSNQAWVKFDTNPYNPAPKEGPWVNTIDAGVPQSNVLPLHDTTTLATFQVSWTGQDDTNGSGIASYDIYVSIDGGHYTLWKDDITETSAIYTGQAGHIYSFYSIAKDHVGHEEQAPNGPDTTIRVLNPVYRFWSPVLSRHFYTISESEKNKLINNYSNVWTYEQVAYYAFAGDAEANTAPVYRFWSGTLNAHFYTMSQTERDKLINQYSHVWTFEGTAFYAYAAGSQPVGTSAVYRFWSGTLNCHFFTIDPDERDKLINLYPHVWTYELIAWYAYAV